MTLEQRQTFHPSIDSWLASSDKQLHCWSSFEGDGRVYTPGPHVREMGECLDTEADKPPHLVLAWVGDKVLHGIANPFFYVRQSSFLC